MLYGTGIDIVDTKKIEHIIKKWDHSFLTRVFTLSEIEHCFSRKKSYNSFAVRFAAKEAVIKSLGLKNFYSLTNIEVQNKNGGKPEIALKGDAKKMFENKVGAGKIHLSLSHDGDFGVASVVIEKRDPNEL